VVVRDDLITYGTLFVGVVLALIIRFGRRHNVHEARFDSETGKEIE
jgi:hypothetical protein